jgi:hypothetical protein
MSRGDSPTKRDELAKIVADALQESLAASEREALNSAVQTLLDCGISIQSPAVQTNPPEIRLDLLTMNTLRPNMFGPDLTGAESIKPGNIRVDMQRLLVAGAQTVRDIASTIRMPWLSPMTALILWDRLYSLLRIKIEEKEACVIWVMWMNCDQERTVEHAVLLPKVNENRNQYGHAPLSEQELSKALSTLERMRCIERLRDDHTRWWLREWIRVKYR